MGYYKSEKYCAICTKGNYIHIAQWQLYLFAKYCIIYTKFIFMKCAMKMIQNSIDICAICTTTVLKIKVSIC